MLEIIHLSNRPDFIVHVTKWLWHEWGAPENEDFFKDLVEKGLNKKDIPQFFIALLDAKLVGTVALLRNDLKSRQDLYPWLACLFVDVDYRSKGIGIMLQNFAIKQTKSLGYDNLYLFTDLEDYYEKSGWEFIGTGCTYSGEYVRLYKMELHNT
ncbi:MAG TPA: GNAT family N-acetyltransferase [Desulfosporosinus sp.]